MYPLHSTNFNNGGIEPAETAVRPQKNIIYIWSFWDAQPFENRDQYRETSLEGAFRFIADLAMSIQISLLTVKNINWDQSRASKLRPLSSERPLATAKTISRGMRPYLTASSRRQRKAYRLQNLRPDCLLLLNDAYPKVWTERSISAQLRQTPKDWVADQGRTGKWLASDNEWLEPTWGQYQFEYLA